MQMVGGISVAVAKADVFQKNEITVGIKLVKI